jgi:hypothetical protein
MGQHAHSPHSAVAGFWLLLGGAASTMALCPPAPPLVADVFVPGVFAALPPAAVTVPPAPPFDVLFSAPELSFDVLFSAPELSFGVLFSVPELSFGVLRVALHAPPPQAPMTSKLSQASEPLLALLRTRLSGKIRDRSLLIFI